MMPQVRGNAACPMPSPQFAAGGDVRSVRLPENLQRRWLSADFARTIARFSGWRPDLSYNKTEISNA
jgi:hypothetical protein